jgi:phosphomannomutase
MTLIKSISGIRGTIGHKPGEGLTPPDIVRFSSAYAIWLQKQGKKKEYNVIIGRDARISGEMVNQIVCGTLMGMGVNITDIGLASTPTVGMAVQFEKADGGIILTASHNPVEWNALKLLNNKGEFISALDGEELLEIADNEDFTYAGVFGLGKYKTLKGLDEKHINAITALPLTDTESIRERNFRIVIDCVNSVGGIVLPELLNALGVNDIIKINCNPDGIFPHNPEPLPEHLEELSRSVIENKADLGIAVDPDVDRLAIVNEDGSMFGEEYTLVAIADYVLKHNPGNTVSNLSSTRALKELTESFGGIYYATAVGEVNVVTGMKLNGAVIGGEGNGGVIYPELHYGRDALAGIALFLSHLAQNKVKCSELRARYPDYFLSKSKLQLSPDTDTDDLLASIKNEYSDYPVNDIDGIRIDFPEGWVHLRKSNTEPVIRIYAEANTREEANLLTDNIMQKIKRF